LVVKLSITKTINTLKLNNQQLVKLPTFQI
jgi:hypothetical protein